MCAKTGTKRAPQWGMNPNRNEAWWLKALRALNGIEIEHGRAKLPMKWTGSTRTTGAHHWRALTDRDLELLLGAPRARGERVPRLVCPR